MQTISQLGIDRIFTLVGDHLNDVLAEAARAGIPITDMRHESGVTHAADAWARIHRRPALALVTGGPGHTNSLTGIATAYLAASPLIAVSGSRASSLAGRQAFQDIDQMGMARPVVKWAAEAAAAAQIPFYLSRAYAEANSGRRGPVHLTIPVDIFKQEASGNAAPSPGPPAEAAPEPDSRLVERALELLRAAERPVVIAGSGVWWSRAEAELRAFIERTSLPLYTITMARGVMPDDHPLVLGYADPALNHAVQTVFKEADLFLVVGKRIDYRLAFGGARLFPPSARFMQVDIHPQELGMNRALEVAICADARRTLAALAASAGAPWQPRPWLERLRALRGEWEERLAACAGDRGTPIHAAAFYAELRRALPAGALYSWDGGDFTHWGRASMPALQPGGWLRLGPLGAIGSALPNGIALQLANPGRPVAVITGDGSLGFYLAELDTAVRAGLPIVVIVGNDAGWGLERELQRAATGTRDTVACELRPTRFDLLMKGMGGAGEHVETLDQVGPAVRRAFDSGLPYCIDVAIRGARSPFTEWQIAGKRK